jgi:hypothetical protein
LDIVLRRTILDRLRQFVAAGEYYYAIEIDGTVCGYVRFTTAPLLQGAEFHERIMRPDLSTRSKYSAAVIGSIPRRLESD